MSFQTMVSGSNQPPRNHPWFTFTAESSTVAEKPPSSWGLSLPGGAPEHEPARRGPHLLLVALDSHEVPGGPGKNGFHGRVRLVVESVFQGGHGKARVVGVAQFERAPPVIWTSSGTSLS